MNVENYLKKLKCENFQEVSLDNLEILQKRNLCEFAFENIDLHMNKYIEYSLEKTYDRLINKSRGGYCLQLNTLFGWLLENLGYNVSYVPCFIYNSTLNGYFRLPIHILLIIELDNRKYYVDVGTTRFINEPIELCEEKIQNKSLGLYQFRKVDDFYELKRKSKANNSEWIPQVKFKLEPKELSFFKEMNEYVQTEEHPTIFFRSVISKQFENGIRYLIGNKYTEIVFDKNFEETRTNELLNNDEVKLFIKEKFNLVVENIDKFEPVDNLDSYFASLKNI